MINILKFENFANFVHFANFVAHLVALYFAVLEGSILYSMFPGQLLAHLVAHLVLQVAAVEVWQHVLYNSHEPNTFSLRDLKNPKNGTECWDGIRNYQARNFMRDEKLDDHALLS